jgi:hypothetical protein
MLQQVHRGVQERLGELNEGGSGEGVKNRFFLRIIITAAEIFFRRSFCNIFIKMNSKHSYQYFEVLYKTDDSPGWYIALLVGNSKEVEFKCQQLWKTYQILSGGEWMSKIEDNYPHNPYACDIHMRTNWIYSIELNKWFLPSEIIPTPTSKCKTYNKFNLIYSFDEDDNTIDDLQSSLFDVLFLHDEEAVEMICNLCFKAGSTEYSIRFLYAHYYGDRIISFLDSIENQEFSYFIIEEYWYVKILVWTIGDQCRIKIQSYQDAEVSEPLDFTIDKQTCIDTFSNFFERLDSEYVRMEKMTLESLTEEDRNVLRERHESMKDYDWHYKF